MSRARCSSSRRKKGPSSGAFPSRALRARNFSPTTHSTHQLILCVITTIHLPIALSHSCSPLPRPRHRFCSPCQDVPATPARFPMMWAQTKPTECDTNTSKIPRLLNCLGDALGTHRPGNCRNGHSTIERSIFRKARTAGPCLRPPLARLEEKV